MAIDCFRSDIEYKIGREELSGLYRIALPGNKKPEDLEKVFSGNMFRYFFKYGKTVQSAVILNIQG